MDFLPLGFSVIPEACDILRSLNFALSVIRVYPSIYYKGIPIQYLYSTASNLKPIRHLGDVS